MRLPILLLAAALAVPAPAAASVGGFRLPPSPDSQQTSPAQQGPVVPDVPESRRPQATTSSPSASPSPSPAPVQVELPPAQVLTPRAAPSRETPSPRQTRAPLPANTTSEPVVAPPAATPEPLPAAQTPVVEGQAPVVAPKASQPGSPAWPWLAGGLGLLGLAGFGAWLWRRRRERGPIAVPEIERPHLAEPDRGPVAPPLPEPAASPLPAPGFAALLEEPLQITLEPLKLSLTLVNATLSYRLEVANHGPSALTGLAIGADMISAHASMTREEQLSGPVQGSAPPQRVDRLEPGESRVVEGEFRVPFSQIVPIRQGNAALLLPLARFRVEADGAKAVVRTFAVGQPGANAALQPFRLDQGPRVYPTLTQHAFA